MNLQNERVNTNSDFQTFKVNGKISKDRKKITDFITSELRTKFSKKQTEKNLTFLDSYDLKNSIDHQLSDEMNLPITKNEVKTGLQKMTKKSTCGVDNCPSKLIYFIFEICPDFIIHAINELFTLDHNSHDIIFTKYIRFLKTLTKITTTYSKI